jgi:Glycosyl transferases group 1
MRIGYVGNFSLPYCTEVHVARTLEQLGHTVIRFQENGFTPDGLSAALDGAEIDLLMFTRTWGSTVRMEHLKRLQSRGIPTASFHLDLYVGLKRDGGIDSDPFWRTDFVFTPDGDPACQAEFERRGINHRWLRPGVVADECYIDDVPLEHDIIFVGSRAYHSEWPYRGQLIDWLERTYGSRFEMYGNATHWGVIRGDDLNKLYASSRIVIGDSLVQGFTHQAYASDRRFETPGRGGFMIQPWIDGLNDGFVDGVNAAFYRFGDFDSLAAKIRHYLVHDNERERIRRAGHEHTVAHHTYTHRMTEMLDVLRAEGAIH